MPTFLEFVLESSIYSRRPWKAAPFLIKQVKLRLQRPAARYDALAKIGGGYGSLVSMFSRVVSSCPWLPN